jgi:ribosome recycling factor
MTNFEQKTPPVRTEAAKRAQRLAEELRANLRKRKEKARSSADEHSGGDATEQADSDAD